MKLTQGKIMDLWITDPPYNVDYGNKNDFLNRTLRGNRIQQPIKNDKKSDEDFQEMINKSFVNAETVLKKGGVFYIFHADLHGKFFRKAVDFSRLQLKQVLQWVKDNIVIGTSDYQWLNEPCLYGWKDGAGHYFSGDRKQKTVIDLPKKAFRQREDGRFEFRIAGKLYSVAPDAVLEEEITNFLEFPKPLKSKDHPTTKPISLWVYLIRNSSRRGENIFDTFCGSGTTIVAAEQTDRTAFCAELDPHYCDVIRRRWAEFIHGENCDWQKLTPEE